MTPSEERPVAVSETTTQTGNAPPTQWDGVERSVWTDRMLKALEEGVKGGVGFSLIDKVRRIDTLRLAFQRVRARKGGPGVDHQTIEAFEKRLEQELGRLHDELRTGRYRPRPIKRKWIDKPGQKKEQRPLGIPSVRDRVVQAALRLVIEPIFEREFTAHSYGFRPGRGCKDALRRVTSLLDAGYTWVGDADLKGYFDSIPKDRLVADVRRRIADGRILDLLGQFLQQPVMDGLTQWTPERGTPQGAVISPLLANIYLHPVDVDMAGAGYEMVRYADDFVILCRSREEAEAALERVRHLCDKRGLDLHPDKTHIVDARIKGQGFDFLGYHFEPGKRWPCKKSEQRIKDRIRRKTRRTNGHSMAHIVAEVNRSLRGWFEYFKHSHWTAFERLDGWIRRRLRSILRKRHKSLHGISRRPDHQRWPNAHFRAHGLYFLADARRACRQSARG